MTLVVFSTVGFGGTTVASGEGIGETSRLRDIVGAKVAVGVARLVGDAAGFCVDDGVRVAVAV